MNFCLKLSFFLRRNASSLVRAIPELNKDIYDKIGNDDMKAKKHPGILKRTVVNLPPEIIDAINLVTGDTPPKQLIKEAKAFINVLKSRHGPPEEKFIYDKRQEFVAEVKGSLGVNLEDLDTTDQDYYSQVIRSKVDWLMKQRIYNWKKIEFTRHQSLVYMYGRSAAEYSALVNIFNELSSRQNFNPSSIFDFGSGIGTVVWAANSIWGDKSIKEVFTVDSSSEINDLSHELALNIKNYHIKNRIFQRQFLPASQNNKYDLVTCAFSLLELPSQSARLETVLNLWQKTRKMLVLVEQGRMSCFKVLNEARDFILGLNNEDTSLKSHIVAPCPHDLPCPKMKSSVPLCSFQTKFKNNFISPDSFREPYSYIVFAKGPRPEDDKCWPRIISPVVVRSRQAICRLCTNSGQLNEVIVSHGKNGKISHHCARSSSWGDLLPVSLTVKNPIKEETTENDCK